MTDTEIKSIMAAIIYSGKSNPLIDESIEKAEQLFEQVNKRAFQWREDEEKWNTVSIKKASERSK